MVEMNQQGSPNHEKSPFVQHYYIHQDPVFLNKKGGKAQMHIPKFEELTKLGKQ